MKVYTRCNGSSWKMPRYNAVFVLRALSSKALLAKNPDPDEETIRYWLAGNLCRCTGYDKIVRAVQDAAAEMSHPAKV